MICTVLFFHLTSCQEHTLTTHKHCLPPHIQPLDLTMKENRSSASHFNNTKFVVKAGNFSLSYWIARLVGCWYLAYEARQYNTQGETVFLIIHDLYCLFFSPHQLPGTCIKSTQTLPPTTHTATRSDHEKKTDHLPHTSTTPNLWWKQGNSLFHTELLDCWYRVHNFYAGTDDHFCVLA